MLSICTHRYLLFKKQEIWFFNGESIKNSDYTTYCYANTVLNQYFDSELNEQTSIIDLTKKTDELYDSINTTFKYHIRKAKKIGFEINVILKPSIEDCNNIVNVFKEFALEKQITPMNKRRIFALQRSNNLIITKIAIKNIDISTHVYLHDEQRILLMHTFHNFDFIDTKIRGYANKYLHWSDILLFKDMNFKVYDFGGVNLEKVPGISTFKLSFGGKIVEANSYTRIASLYRWAFRLYKIVMRTI